MNSLVALYRQRVQNDPRTDDQITKLLGQQNTDHRYDKFQDFVQDYQRLTNPQPEEQEPPTLGGEIGKGFSRGASSLAQSAVGLGALASDALGLDSAKNYFLQKYQERQQEDADNAPAVGKVEDIHGIGDAAMYAAGKAGELIPSLGEAAVIGAAGSIAGSALAPGPGTVAGGAGGAIEGFLGRQAAKSILDTLLEKGLKKYGLDEATGAIVKSQLEGIAKRETVENLAPQTANLLKSELASKAKKIGFDATTFANFGAIGAGGTYPGIEAKNPDDAKGAAMIAGVGNALSALLPAATVHKLFPGVGEEVAKDYVTRLAVDAAKEIPAATAGMGLMEVSNIAAERYADPELRDKPLTDEEKSRILNASVVGAATGALMAPLTAIPGPKTKIAPEMEHHVDDVPDDRRVQLEQLKGRIEQAKAENKSPSADDLSQVRSLTPKESAYYALAEAAEPTRVPPKEVEPGVVSKSPAQAGAPADTTNTPSAAPSISPEKLDEISKSSKTIAEVQQKILDAMPPADTPEQLAAKAKAAQIITAPRNDPVVAAAQSAVKAAELKTDSNPSLAQKGAENYKKGPLKGKAIGLPGLTIKVENPKGSVRTGKDGSWSVTMPDTYGQILGTKGADGDPIDIHIGPNPAAEKVYVIDQKDAATGKHDEHKVMVGFESQAQAEAAYDAGFSDGKGPQRRGAVTTMSKDEFRTWLKEGDTTKPLKFKEESNAETVRSDKGQLPTTGEVSEKGKATGGNDLEQPAPKQSEPVGKGEEKVGSETKGRENATGEVKSETKEAKTATKEAKNEPVQQAEKQTFKEEGSNKPGSSGSGNREKEVHSKENGGDVGSGKDDEVKPKSDEELLKLVEEKKEPEKPKEKQVKPEHVDVERNLVEKESGRGKHGEGKATVEPGWFRPTGDESMLKMGERLTSDSSPPTSENLAEGETPYRNSQTYRVTSVLDQKTGKVHVLSTFENNDEARLTKFEDMGRKQDKSVALTKVMREKMENGENRFKILSSARTRELTEYAHDEYPDQSTWEKEFAKPIEDRQSSTRRTVGAVEEKIQQGKDFRSEQQLQEDKAKEHPETGEGVEAEGEAGTEDEREHEPEPLNLEQHEVERVASALKTHTLDELVDAITTGALKGDKDLIALLGKIGKADPEFFGRVESVGIDKALKEYGYKTNAGEDKPLESSAIGGKEGGVRHDKGSGSGPEADVQSGQNLPGQEQEQGGKQGNQEPGGAGQGVKFNLPDGSSGGRVSPEDEKRASESRIRSLERSVNASESQATLRPSKAFYQDTALGGRAGGREGGKFGRAIQAIARLSGTTLDIFEGRKTSPWYVHEGGIFVHDQAKGSVFSNVGCALSDLIRQSRPDVFQSLKAELSRILRTRVSDDYVDRIVGDTMLRPGFWRDYGTGALFESAQHWGPLSESLSRLDEDVGFNTPQNEQINRAVAGFLDAAAERPKLRESEAKLEQVENPENRRLHNEIVNALRQAGVNVEEVPADKLFGIASTSDRSVLLGVRSVLTRQNILTDIHEAGHIAFGDESPEMQAKLLRGVSQLPDRALGLEFSSDPRIRETNPDSMGKEGLQEERLVETTAMSLERQGFSPEQAKGFAQRFVRALKDYYMRAVMKVQEALGFRQNPEMALKYFENRLKMMLAGDRVGQSYTDFIGVRPLAVGDRRQRSYSSTRSTAETLDRMGLPVQEHVPEWSTAATRFNMDAIKERWKFNLPDNEVIPKQTRTTDVERMVATLNHRKDLVGSLAKTLEKASPEVSKLIEKSKKSPASYLMDLLGVSDPAKEIELLQNEREPDGSKVKFDINKKVEDFKGKANSDHVLLNNFNSVRSLMSTMDGIRDDANREIRRGERSMKRAEASLAEAQENMRELEEIKADKSKVIPNLDELEERYKKELSDAKGAVASLKRQMDREKVRLSLMDTLSPAVAKEHDRLAAKWQIRPDFVFRDGASINVPADPKASTEDLSKFTNTKTLKLNPSGREVTTQAELNTWIKKMHDFLTHREALDKAGDENAKDIGYNTVAQQLHEVLAHTIGGLDLDLKPANRWSFLLTLMPDGDRISDGIGSRAARSIKRRLNDYTVKLDSIHAYNEKMGRITGQLEEQLLNLVPGIGNLDLLRQNIISPVKDMLKGHHDLEEAYAGNPSGLKRALFQRIKDELLRRDTTKGHLEPVVDRFMPKLQELIDHQWAMANKRLEMVKATRLGVEDPRIGKIEDLATGKMVPATRRHADIGAYSFPRKLAGYFSTMVKALRGSGWGDLGNMLKGGQDNASPLEEALIEGPDAARELLKPFFNHFENGDQVRRNFFQALAETPGTFDAPAIETKPGEKAPRIPADQAHVIDAMNASGPADPIGFAKKLFELHGGKGNENQFIMDILQRLYDRFKEANGMYAKYEPSDTPGGVWQIRGMSPDALIDARTVEHLPARWFDYHAYDMRESHSMAQRIAAEAAFGRNQEGLGSDFDTAAKEVNDANDRLIKARDEAKNANPNASTREIDKLVKAKLPDYETLKRVAGQVKSINAVTRGLSDYFRKEGNPDITMNYVSRFAHTLGQLLVNQPTSALNQLEQLFGLHIRYGAGGSAIGGTANTLKKFGSEAIQSMAQAIGLQMQDNSWTGRIWKEAGLNDPHVVKQLQDIRVRQTGETAVGQTLRGISEAPGIVLNKLGAKAEHTAFTPLQPFNWVATVSERALTESLWKMVGAHIQQGIDFLRSNPQHMADEWLKLDSKTMGLSGREKYTFDRLTKDMNDWGLDFTDMVHKAMQRSDGAPFGTEEAVKLYSMGLSNVLSESSLATMPSSSFTSGWYRAISPLLGWSFRRGMAVLEAGRTPDGKRDLASMANGIAGLMLLAGGGLGTAAIVNAYSENVLGKKRNLRPMDTAMGLWENLNRVGSFGIFGELINKFANIGTGADNRALDLDQRIVVLSALNSLTSAVSSFTNQDYQADYAHVIRPMLQSMGAGGALQYMQLANRALGLDTMEARASARTNARNWLMAGGREIGMDVRETGGGGGYASVTPLSPSLTRMELAAYGNNAGDFMQAYREAVAKAKEMGNDDPVDYVKRAFSARNPLRSVFQTAPSVSEYRRLLGALPGNGSSDVQEAVKAFNTFSERIGARPFEGKQEKKTSINPRAMAVAAFR